METASKPPASLFVVVLLLLIGGGIIFYGLRGLSSDVSSPAQSIAAQKASPAAFDPAAALRDAIQSNDVSALRALKERKVDLDAPYQLIETGRRTMTPLTLAAMQPSPDMVRALLAAGAKPEIASENGTTPLMMAAARSDAATVETLIKAGAPVDAQDKWGRTALQSAALCGSIDKVRLLLAARASPKLADSEGTTALSCAAGLGGTPEILRTLLESGSDPDAANSSGVTPLMRAAEAGDVTKCIALLNGGAKPHLKDADGRTAADWAAMRSDEQGAKCAALLAHAGD